MPSLIYTAGPSTVVDDFYCRRHGMWNVTQRIIRNLPCMGAGHFPLWTFPPDNSPIRTFPPTFSADIKKRKRKCIAVNGIPSHSYEVSLAIWDHTVLPATRHKWAHPPAIQAGIRFTYYGGMEGWVDLGDLLHTEMVYPPAGGHPSKY